MALSDFSASDSKKIIRRQWDRPILEEAARTLKHRLSYFGLPGPAIEDLLDWKDLIGTVTGVEHLRQSGTGREEDLERHRRLHRNVATNDFQDFQLLRGDIENIILDTTDLDGYVPKLNDGRPPHQMCFRYDLVNLDFFGGVGHRNKQGESRRVRALKKLFERQEHSSFVLLITLSLRDNIDDELRNYLEQTCKRVDQQLQDIVTWYATRGKGEKEYKLKAVVPLFVQSMAEGHMFSSHAFPPVAYDGTGGVRMIHFTFALTYILGNLRAFSQQLIADLINLPLVCIEDGVLRVSAKQHPGYDFTRCAADLAFLPEETRIATLTTIPVLSPSGNIV